MIIKCLIYFIKSYANHYNIIMLNVMYVNYNNIWSLCVVVVVDSINEYDFACFTILCLLLQYTYPGLQWPYLEISKTFFKNVNNLT